jgi:integral membrane protein
VSAALLRYRIMAYVVGTLLIVLVCVGVPLDHLTTEGTSPQSVGAWITMNLGVLHGFLYMIFLVAAADLARRARFPLPFALMVLLLGTVPFLSFVAERLATGRVRQLTKESEVDGALAP